MTDVQNGALFVAEHAPTGDVLRQFTGMDETTVTALMADYGHAFDFLTKDDFDTRMAAAIAKLPAELR